MNKRIRGRAKRTAHRRAAGCAVVALAAVFYMQPAHAQTAASRIAPQAAAAPQTPAPPPAPKAGGSLFSDAAPAVDLFVDFKPRRAGDLVFVDVVEASEASVQSGASRKRDSGALGGIGTLAGAVPLPGAGVVGGVVGALGTRKFEGKGATDRRSDLRARIVARVVEVLPNGDLVIEASKLVRINKETERLQLAGIVRQRDVTAENSVPTSAVGDLRVEINGKGVASADNAPGWLFRFFERVTKF